MHCASNQATDERLKFCAVKSSAIATDRRNGQTMSAIFLKRSKHEKKMQTKNYAKWLLFAVLIQVTEYGCKPIEPWCLMLINRKEWYGVSYGMLVLNRWIYALYTHVFRYDIQFVNEFLFHYGNSTFPFIIGNVVLRNIYAACINMTYDSHTCSKASTHYCWKTS